MAPNAPPPVKGGVRVPTGSAAGVGPYGASVSEQVRVDTREVEELEEDAEPARRRAR
jgi:hypothetical protein